MLSSIAYSNDFLTWNKKQKKGKHMENQKTQFQNQRNVETWTCPFAFILVSRFVLFVAFIVHMFFLQAKKQKNET